MSLMSPVLADRFFSISDTLEAQIDRLVHFKQRKARRPLEMGKQNSWILLGKVTKHS